MIDVSLMITIISVGFAVFTGVAALRRNHRIDDQGYSSAITTVIVKLEGIAEDTKEIKEQVHGLDNKIQNLDKRVTILETAISTVPLHVDDIKED